MTTQREKTKVSNCVTGINKIAYSTVTA